MKFIFFYSQIYEFYYNHINKNISEIFDVEAIKINDLKNQGYHTFHNGISIKIELIIEKIKENFGNIILFTDATIIINSNNVNQLKDFFNKYSDNDLCFADNNINFHYNIGIILIKCNEKTISFFENVLIDLINDKGWDQGVVNKHLKNNYDLKIYKFDKEKIYCGYNFNPKYKDTFLIYKSFIQHDKNINITFNNRFDIFKKYGLITDKEYNDNYKII